MCYNISCTSYTLTIMIFHSRSHHAEQLHYMCQCSTTFVWISLAFQPHPRILGVGFSNNFNSSNWMSNTEAKTRLILLIWNPSEQLSLQFFLLLTSCLANINSSKRRTFCRILNGCLHQLWCFSMRCVMLSTLKHSKIMPGLPNTQLCVGEIHFMGQQRLRLTQLRATVCTASTQACLDFSAQERRVSEKLT